jgi:hypothetical protein
MVDATNCNLSESQIAPRRWTLLCGRLQTQFTHRVFLEATFIPPVNECPAFHRLYSEPFEYSAELSFLRPILVLSYHLHLRFPSSLLPSNYPNNTPRISQANLRLPNMARSLHSC